ncbi:hypothetical protein ES706_06020 [subsurface metagenome]
MPSLHWSLSFAPSDLSEFAFSGYPFVNSIYEKYYRCVKDL